MSQENDQSGLNNKNTNLTKSVSTNIEINELKIPNLSEKNEEDKKEYSLSKNNNSGNQNYISNNNVFEEENLFKKQNSGKIIEKKDFDENSIDEESEKLQNLLAKKNVNKPKNNLTKSQNLYNILKNNINNNYNDEEKNKFSVVINKNENSFDNLDSNDNNDNNNNIYNNNNDNNNDNNNIKHSKIHKNPIYNTLERLKQETNNYSGYEQLKEGLKNNIKKCRLENYGDTSYLNTILQCLANIEILKIYFLNENIGNHIKGNIRTLPLSFVTQRLFNHFYVKKDQKYTLESYLRVLGSLNMIYLNRKSRNVKDCLIFILDSLHNELNRIKNNNENYDFKKTDKNEVINYGTMIFKNKYDSIISDTFNWQEIKELHCIECGQISFDFQTYNTIELDCLNFQKTIGINYSTIYDCLKYELYNKKINSFCIFCKKKAKINIISRIYKSPKIFVFLLNNGDFDEKLLKLIFNLEPIINLSKFIDFKKSPKKYELIGIISIDLNQKNYINYCKSFEDNNWYFFYDENVAQVTEGQVIMDNNGKFIPCALFYKSID